jgi:hypothetical protein
MIWFAPLHKSYKYFMAILVALFIVCLAVPSLREMEAYYFVGLTLLIVFYGGLIADRGRQRRELEQEKLPAYYRMLPNWDHLCYCQSCQTAWLDTAPLRNVPVKDTEKLLAG